MCGILTVRIKKKRGVGMEENLFELVAPFSPQGDQKKAIEQLSEGILNGEKYQVLLGATGTGKTFIIIRKMQIKMHLFLFFSGFLKINAYKYSKGKNITTLGIRFGVSPLRRVICFSYYPS